MGHTDPAGLGPATGADVTNTESSVSDGLLQAHDQEARLLVELLRTSRLALLFGPAGSDKTALLQHDLMPLMRRRAVDQPASDLVRETGVVVPFQDRRSRDAIRASKRRREIIVYFDDWTEAPLAALQARIHQAAAVPLPAATTPRTSLGDTLSALSGLLNATVIILLDRFEQLLNGAPDRPGVTEFTDDLVGAVNEPGLSANFLIALDEAARPKLTTLRKRIPGFDDFSLKLTGPLAPAPVVPGAQRPAPPTPCAIGRLPVQNEALADRGADIGPASMGVGVASTRHAATTPRAKLPPPSRTAMKTDDVYALIQATLARTATQAMDETAALGGGAAEADGTRPGATPAPMRRSHRPRPALPAPRPPLPGTAPNPTNATNPTRSVGSKPRLRMHTMTLSRLFKWVLRHLLRQPGS